MINFDDVKKENLKEHNPNWQQIPDHLYRILINASSASGKTNSLLNLINHQPYAKDPFEAKYQLLINNRESTGLTYLNHSKVFLEHFNDMDDIYKKIEEHNPNK